MLTFVIKRPSLHTLWNAVNIKFCFYCELNPIERVWGQAKVYAKKAIVIDHDPCVGFGLCGTHAEGFIKACLEQKKAGKELEQAVKLYKSQRRIFYEAHP